MRDYPNQSEKTVILSPESCTADCEISTGSAYDLFYAQLMETIRLAGGATNPTMVRLCLLGVTSITEEYFRASLSGITRVCPKCSIKAGKENISVAASLYYPKEGVGYALMEHVGFSDADTIKKQTKRLCELEIPESSSLAEALREFDKVCHLRHAIIHSNGRLSAQNASKIGLSNGMTSAIALTLASFQDIAEICLNTVRAYNRFLWDKTIDRWVKGKIVIGKFDDEKVLIRQLVALLCEGAETLINDEAELNNIYQAAIVSRIKSEE